MKQKGTFRQYAVPRYTWIASFGLGYLFVIFVIPLIIDGTSLFMTARWMGRLIQYMVLHPIDFIVFFFDHFAQMFGVVLFTVITGLLLSWIVKPVVRRRVNRYVKEHTDNSRTRHRYYRMEIVDKQSEADTYGYIDRREGGTVDTTFSYTLVGRYKDGKIIHWGTSREKYLDTLIGSYWADEYFDYFDAKGRLLDQVWYRYPLSK